MYISTKIVIFNNNNDLTRIDNFKKLVVSKKMVNFNFLIFITIFSCTCLECIFGFRLLMSGFRSLVRKIDILSILYPYSVKNTNFPYGINLLNVFI